MIVKSQEGDCSSSVEISTLLAIGQLAVSMPGCSPRPAAHNALGQMDRRVCGIDHGEGLFAGSNQTEIKGLKRSSSLHDSFGVARTMPIPLSPDIKSLESNLLRSSDFAGLAPCDLYPLP
jgi:hypothetical protein